MSNKRGRKPKKADYYNIFAEHLRSLIEESGAKQQEIADNIGVSRQALNKWINGETVPDIFSATKIANIFNVSIDYLMGRTNIKTVFDDIGYKQMLHLVTGLSDQVVTTLFTKSDEVKNTLNDFICYNEFWDFLNNLIEVSKMQQRKITYDFVHNTISDILNKTDKKIIDYIFKDYLYLYANNELFPMEIYQSGGYDLAVTLYIALIQEFISDYIKSLPKKDNNKEADKLIEYLENKQGNMNKILTNENKLSSKETVFISDVIKNCQLIISKLKNVYHNKKEV